MSPQNPGAAWVKPPEPIRGLDHLGAQAPCVALYTDLLPGITNVTDRARYYSFYPWLIWSFEHRYKDHSLDEFRRILRRAECLFALIAIRHARVASDEGEDRHGAGMVGRLELLRVSSDAESITLEEFAALEGPRRYFKNKLGGLGQYYFGPLRDLLILDRSEQGTASPPGYDLTRGRELAEAFALGVPEDAFFEALEAPDLTWRQLDDLAAFCPCALSTSSVEHELLLDLFLARPPGHWSEGGQERRASLGLMLDLANRSPECEEYPFQYLFRGAAYSGTLADDSAWPTEGALQRARLCWATYQRNELLSVAVQGLFAAILRATERDRRGTLVATEEAGDVGLELLSESQASFSRPLVDIVEEVRSALPSLADWQDPRHEVQRGWQLYQLSSTAEHLEQAAVESIQILLALLARGIDEDPYAHFEDRLGALDPREIHLQSLRTAWRTEWSAMSLAEWIRWLSVHWCVRQHLRVALRKLHGQSRDTFRIRPLEGSLRVVEAPPPAYTVPRISNTVQILRDLGLIQAVTEPILLTAQGRRELEAYREG